MKKKIYISPKADAILVKATEILAGSPTINYGGNTGENLGKEASYFEDFSFDFTKE